MSTGRTDFAGIAALITAIGGIIFGAIKLENNGSAQADGYAVLAKSVQDLTAAATANNQRITTLESALAIVAAKAAASPVAEAHAAAPPPAPAEVTAIAARLKTSAANAQPLRLERVPSTLQAVVQARGK